MATAELTTVRLHYREWGEGAPLLLVHGAGSDGNVWGDAPDMLARWGRVIAYDRRGYSRSDRPPDYRRTTPAEQADDAAELLLKLGAVPAIVIGRSYGGEVALNLAWRYPDRIRALVLLDGGGRGVSAAADEMLDGLADRILEAVASGGPAAAGDVLLRTVLGDAGYSDAPEALKSSARSNGPAIAADVVGLKDERPTVDALPHITCPVLVVAGTDSPPVFRDLNERLAELLPDGRLTFVQSGHLVSPTDAAVTRFLADVLKAG